MPDLVDKDCILADGALLLSRITSCNTNVLATAAMHQSMGSTKAVLYAVYEEGQPFASSKQ
jgi:hypothetical protein